jgi:hypothetical protein
MEHLFSSHLKKGVYACGGLVFNATFNNISVISWWSILLVEETGVPEENHRQGVVVVDKMKNQKLSHCRNNFKI